MSAKAQLVRSAPADLTAASGVEPLTVLFDHRIFIEQEHGGISRYFAAMINELPEFGIRPRVFSPLHVNAYLSDLPAPLRTGYRLKRDTRLRFAARRINQLLTPLAARAAGAKLVHETYFGYARSAPAGVPTVLTVYDMIVERYGAANDPVAARKRAAIERADWVACISESTRRDMLALYPDAERKSSVTLLGFDAPPADFGPPPIERPYLLHVGGRHGYKNFGGLLEAYAGSARLMAEFDIVAAGVPFLADERARIADLGLRERVHQCRASDAQLQSCYRHAAAFVYPSLYEGFGIPPLEAMAVGCPVVTMRNSSIPEVCGAAAEYAASETAGALRAAIEAVVFSPSRREALRLAGEANLARFSWARCAEQTAAIYRALT